MTVARGQEQEYTCASLQVELIPFLAVSALVDAEELPEEVFQFEDEALALFALQGCEGDAALVTFNGTEFSIPPSTFNFESCEPPGPDSAERGCVRASCSGGKLAAVAHVGICCDATDGVTPTLTCALPEPSSGNTLSVGAAFLAAAVSLLAAKRL